MTYDAQGGSGFHDHVGPLSTTITIGRASTPEPQHVELYELLGVPTKIMAPRKTWSEGEVPHSDGKNA